VTHQPDFDKASRHTKAHRFLLTGGEGEELGRFVTVRGLFKNGTRPNDRRRRLTFEEGDLRDALLNVNLKSERARRIGSILIGMLDRAGRTLGQHWLANVKAEKIAPSSDLNRTWNVTLTGVLLTSVHPDSETLWERWATGQITERNAWTKLSSRERKAWLEVARMRASVVDSSADAPAGAIFDLDGENVQDSVSFLCALGESINGPGGYFGAGFDSFRDCLAGGFGARPPFVIRWHGPRAGRPASKEVAEMIDLLAGASVTIVPAG
jgi:Barstar (barnase inhibitor)